MTKATPTSQRKAAANRRNASRSTGPRTAQGKAWSRLNALKHGILASQAVIATIEGRAERKMFEATVVGLAEDFQPEGAYEQLLVQEIAACFWRKRRLLTFENRAAFDAIEFPTAASADRAKQPTLPWREPLYVAGDQLTTADHIYQEAGLDVITLPNEADTARVIRYEAAINRTRERAVASLREMKKARRGMVQRGATVAPVVDRAAARRNGSSSPARVLSPWFSTRFWDPFKEPEMEKITAELAASRAASEAEGQLDRTKPKTLDIDEIRRSLYRAINGVEMPEESEPTPETPKPDLDETPST